MLILIFPDGETFNTLEGCTISEAAEEELAAGRDEVLYTFKDDDTTRARIAAVV